MIVMTAANEEPLGPAPQFDVGFSDSIILIVSIIGSVILAVTVHSIVLTKLKSAEEIEDEELTYEDQLVNADVSTLNRAQRRARARAIMKQQRRIAPTGTPTDDENNRIEDENPIEPSTAPQLSRKDRQKAAKAAEKEERKILEDDRRQQQEESQKIAQREKQKRQKKMMQQAEAERKARQEQRIADEMTSYKEWKTFLGTLDGKESLTVKEWIQELRSDRYVDIDSLAKRFQVDEETVIQRIQELINESRIAGIHHGNRFIFLSMDEMAQFAEIVKSREKTSVQDLREIVNTIIGD
ncbi:unnamed protein product [Cylindrotheca closterium]|uniref:DDRGK domain-containing protein 1 n=1 Tax=Cylindrotheca closterium TaxID=2856 RepID=A0AAD2GCF3_9STRA|nr:unnamed protein product [Cylindrotheca closterium]